MNAGLDRDGNDESIAPWCVLAAVLPGVALAMSHSLAIDVPRADIIDALDTDKYRIHWVSGSYLVGTAAGMCLTQFIAGLFGLRRAYLFALLLFTAAGGACGWINEIVWMAPLRLMQGLGNGLLISVGMVMIWQAFPQRRERAMAAYGVCTYVPMALGAVVGGLITWFLSWRFIFFALLPTGICAWILAWWLLPHVGQSLRDCRKNPLEAQSEKSASLGETRLHFDFIGLTLWVVSVICLNVMLDMGQYWGWLTSRHFLLWCAGFILSFGGFVAWGFLAKAPVINLRALWNCNAALGLFVKMVFSINLTVLFGLLTTYMVDLRGYQWWQAAVVVLAAAAAMMLAVGLGLILGTPGNRKLRMFVGLAIMIVATTQLMAVDVFSSKVWQAAVLAIWGLGAGLVIEPALVTIFDGLSLAETMPLAGAYNILRAIPAYAALVTLATFWVQDTDAYFDLMRQTVQTNTPIVEQARQTSHTRFVTFGSPHARAEKQSQALLHKWTQENARAFALQIVFRDLAWLTVPALVLVILIRRSPSRPQHEAVSGSGDSRAATAS